MTHGSADGERVAYINYLSAEIQAATDRIYAPKSIGGGLWSVLPS